MDNEKEKSILRKQRRKYTFMNHLANLKRKRRGLERWLNVKSTGCSCRLLSTHARQLTAMCHSSYRNLVPSFGHSRHCTPHMHILTCRCKHINKNEKVNLKRKEGKKK